MATFHPHFVLANLMGEEHQYEWSVGSVKELIDYGQNEFGSDFTDEIKRATILVNGRAINYLSGANTPLSEEDEVWTILPSAGG